MKKLLALVLAIVMILSLSITASALELDEYIYLRIDLEGVMEETTAVLNFGEEVGGLHLSKDNNGYYFNVYYDEKLAGAFTIIVEYYDENGEAVRIESDPMYLADIDGIIVLDENGFHVENTYVFQTADDGRNSKTIPVTGISNFSNHNWIIYLLVGIAAVAVISGGIFLWKKKDEFVEE